MGKRRRRRIKNNKNKRKKKVKIKRQKTKHKTTSGAEKFAEDPAKGLCFLMSMLGLL